MLKVVGEIYTLESGSWILERVNFGDLDSVKAIQSPERWKGGFHSYQRGLAPGKDSFRLLTKGAIIQVLA